MDKQMASGFGCPSPTSDMVYKGIRWEKRPRETAEQHKTPSESETPQVAPMRFL